MAQTDHARMTADNTTAQADIRLDDPARSSGTRVEIGAFNRYSDAQRVVDGLSDDGFPVERLQIVASDLRFVEHVTGRKTTWTATWKGAGSGALFGALIGALLGAFSIVDPLFALWVMAFYGLVIGAVLGAIFGAIGHAMQQGRRDFDTVGTFDADTYRVLADPEVAEEASRRLAMTSTGSTRTS